MHRRCRTPATPVAIVTIPRLDACAVVPPGTVGFLIGSGGFADFDACVTANLSLPPISPTWRLTLPERTE